MKVLILGSSGIIGQHMRLCVPDNVQPIWHRRTSDCLHVFADLFNGAEVKEFLETYRPGIIVNLAGESSTDSVENFPKRYHSLNALMPLKLAEWADANRSSLIQISTQAVFDGGDPPYGPFDGRMPVNEYGRQKLIAEDVLAYRTAIVVRPTFVLGVRPLPHVGRQNPVEQMLAGQKQQVNDRWFSPLFAEDAARLIWRIVTHGAGGQKAIHLGIPKRVSRFDIAQALGLEVEPVSHDSFSGIAPRPVDTTYDNGSSRHFIDWEYGIRQCLSDWVSRHYGGLQDKATELALFCGINLETAVQKLSYGFRHLHHEVTQDFRRLNPEDDAGLLEWYRNTDAYLWELSSYHEDRGFNYRGMCAGISERLKSLGVKSVLVMGDGVGTMTLHFANQGFEATYHDLAGSRTARFAAFRYWRQTGREMPQCLTIDWAPDLSGEYDAIVCSDFLEHVTDVPSWVQAMRGCLKSGGVMFTQNAFGPAMGSGTNGSIPMHLSRNDRYEKEWDPMLSEIGFVQDSSNWYRKSA
jgi:dTDP-4-dehydrorhamnose reductase